MKKDIYRFLAFRKAFFSILIVLIYILGSNITLPGIDAGELINYLKNSPNVSFSLSMTGMSLNKFSVFSVGLGPWMSSLVIWRVLSVTKMFKINQLTNSQAYRVKFIMSFFVGIIQSLGIISQVNFVDQNKYYTIVVVLLLLTGMSILIWMGNLNQKYGIGGPSIIILVGMIRNWPQNISTYIFSKIHSAYLFIFIVIFLIIMLVLSFLIMYFYGGEVRLMVMNIMLDNKYADQSYLPISTNPAGGMPFMYSFSLVLLPQYLMIILSNIYTNNDIIKWISENLQLDKALGILILIITIVLLSYGFAYVNIDHQEIAKNYKKSGDYFVNVYPGKNTEKYLFDNIFIMATIGAIFNGIVIGLPMFMVLYWPVISYVAYIIPTWIIILILVKEIYRQFSMMVHRGSYDQLI